jgi:hypothetical protein
MKVHVQYSELARKVFRMIKISGSLFFSYSSLHTVLIIDDKTFSKFSGISILDWTYLPNVAQPNPTIVTTNRIVKSNVDCSNSKIILQIMSAIVVGSRQYPRTHTLWKNDLE